MYNKIISKVLYDCVIFSFPLIQSDEHSKTQTGNTHIRRLFSLTAIKMTTAKMNTKVALCQIHYSL